MHKYLVLLLLFYPVICKTSDGIVPPETIKNIGVPPIEQEIATDVAKYTELKGTSFITWKDNKQMIVAYRKSNTYQLFTLDKPMGERQQITDFDEPVSNAIVNPDPLVNDLLFQKDTGGDEQHQIFSLNVSNGVSKLLTDGKSKHQAVTFSHDGKQIAFSDNSRTGKYFDVYTMDPNNPETRKLVYKVTHSAYLTPAWSRDAGRLLVREYISASEVASHLLDLRTGKATNLTPNSAGSIFFSLTDFTANDEFVIGLSNQGTEFRKLIRMHLETGEVSIISNNINWDVSGFTLDRNGNKGIFIVNENGFSRLYQFNTENFSTQSLPFGEGIITSAEYSPDGSKLALTFNNARNNRNIYVINLANNERIAWTRSKATGLDLETFVKPELIHFPTFDKVEGEPRMIPAFYYRPTGKRNKHPVVLMIDGGPEGQYRHS